MCTKLEDKVIGDAVTGIELEAARDLHGGGCMVES